MKHYRLGFDATFSIGNYRGMGRYVRQLVGAHRGDIIGFAPRGRVRLPGDAWPLLADGPGPEPLWEQFILPTLAKKSKVDFLLCGYNTAPIFFGETPILLVVHDLIFNNPLPAISRFTSKRQLFGALYRRYVVPTAVRQAHSVLAVSNCARREICNAFDLELDRVKVISNSVQDVFFSADHQYPSESQTRRPYIFTVSGGAPSKNLGNLLRAFAIARKHQQLSGFDLVVAGLNAGECVIYSKFAQELGILDHVLFSKRLSDDELRDTYSGSALFVFASLFEGFGIPLIEAMAMEVPVACSDIPVFKEICDTYVKYFDPNSLGEIVLALVNGVSRRSDISILKEARAHCEIYRFQNVAERMSQFLSAVC